MAKEIERKFLVCDTSYRQLACEHVEIRQGYLSARKEATVRVRLWGDCGFITVKGSNSGAVRDEWEYEIPASDARDMLDRLDCGTILSKTRYIVEYEGYIWEVDEFHGALSGLTLAEVELTDPEAGIPLPPFVGTEVTGDPAYYNSNLASRV